MLTVSDAIKKIQHHIDMNSPVSTEKLIWGWIKDNQLSNFHDFEELIKKVYVKK
jgi:hypothetical protein